MELLRQSPPNPLICLLLGKIGSGKTTFLFRFFNIVLDKEERKQVKWFYVDFKNAPTEKNEIRNYTLKSVLSEFKQKYRSLFENFLEVLKMEQVNPTIENLSKLFLMLKAERIIPALIIANVDQHIFDSPKYHHIVFLVVIFATIPGSSNLFLYEI